MAEQCKAVRRVQGAVKRCKRVAKADTGYCAQHQVTEPQGQAALWMKGRNA
jgi:hypothetical protein